MPKRPTLKLNVQGYEVVEKGKKPSRLRWHDRLGILLIFLVLLAFGFRIAMDFLR